MTKMKAVRVPKAGAGFEVVEREIPEPGAGNVRVRVQACGVCHSDVITKKGLFPGISHPCMPESLDPAEAAPLICAGITTFNALRHSGARPW